MLERQIMETQFEIEQANLQVQLLEGEQIRASNQLPLHPRISVHVPKNQVLHHTPKYFKNRMNQHHVHSTQNHLCRAPMKRNLCSMARHP